MITIRYQDKRINYNVLWGSYSYNSGCQQSNSVKDFNTWKWPVFEVEVLIILI